MDAGVLYHGRQCRRLPYLPDGADIYALTYDELIAWVAAEHEDEGEAKFGFPAGPDGLKHRFFQGYLYPSYTDGVVRKFRSEAAVGAREAFRALWEHTNRDSTNFSFMQEQLLSDEVWIAYDHTSGLANAFNERPEDFVAFPAPAGPEARGFMPVVAGIAIPATAPDMEASTALVGYMSSPETVQSYPNPFIPEIDLGSLSFFANFDGKLSALKNSVIVALITMVMPIAPSAPAGYAPSRFDFHGKELFRILILLTGAFPLPILALPLAVLFIRTGLDDTVFGLAIVHTMLSVPFAVLITFSLFSGIPRELEEAAWTLGCTRFTAFTKVVLP